MRSVLQDWVHELTMMQQTVLLTAIRGPDGLRKFHPSKYVLRWYRRCILLSAMDHDVIENPWDKQRGGSFTGPSITQWLTNGKKPSGAYSALVDNAPIRKHWDEAMHDVYSAYINSTDEMPHHFQAHLRNGVKILGYKHPAPAIRQNWNEFYLRLVDDLHENPETEGQMDYRLGDNREQWLKAGDRSSCGRDDCASRQTPEYKEVASVPPRGAQS